MAPIRREGQTGMCECFEDYECGRIFGIRKECKITLVWRRPESQKLLFECQHGDKWHSIIFPGHPAWRGPEEVPLETQTVDLLAMGQHKAHTSVWLLRDFR